MLVFITPQVRIQILNNILDFIKKYDPDYTEGIDCLSDIIAELELFIKNTSPR